jgi:hypothetical protein
MTYRDPVAAVCRLLKILIALQGLNIILTAVLILR